MKIKARDIVQEFRTKGMERATIETFITLIEHIGVMNQQMNELAQTCNKLIDMLGSTAAGYSDLRRQVERIKNKQSDDDLPDSVN